MRRLKLGYLCADSGIPVDGTKGASVHFREFGRALLREGFELEAVMRRPPVDTFSEFPLRIASRSTSSREPLVRELAEFTDQQGLVRGLEAAGPLDGVYERYSLFGLAGLRHAREAGIPLFLEVNAPLWEEAARYRSLSSQRLARAVAQELLARASRVLVVSEGLRARVIDEGADPSRVVVFPNGVSPRFLETVEPLRRPKPLRGRPVLTFVGSLKPWHGIEMLLQGFLSLPSEAGLGLWVVGDGPEAGRVDRLVAKHPDRVVRTPAVAHEEVPALLRASDITVAPYTSESPSYFCPLKVIEAFAAGVPLLASAVPAVQNLDLGGLSLHSFRPDSVDSFREVLCALLEDLPRVTEEARRNREVARGRYTWDRRAADLRELLEGDASRALHAGAA